MKWQTLTSAKSLLWNAVSKSVLSCLWHLCLGFWFFALSSGYFEPERVLSAPIIETSQTIVRLSSGNHWEDLLFKKSVDINFLNYKNLKTKDLKSFSFHLNPQESGLALNWVKVDLTLFCLFFVTSKIVNSYLAFTWRTHTGVTIALWFEITSDSVWLDKYTDKYPEASGVSPLG